ncbi:hypothetical protein P154DRAFT_541563 [Amniculicola lignicola CBS 123094]|uniref:Uncharacterized protein n=1 Tax=Amniculicola lignicola CBS 123094 TaxID=1392246 RepID=A0A6A5X3C1_9PLEO|nr:hypothetical protein P154DRAFT_541563 [Amniculicola lignicola CBS 123094]
MYPLLYNDVTELLYKDNLFFSFYEKDDDNSCIDDYDMTIMAVWSSKQIAITIQRYSKERYNARLDYSYAERVAYRLKKWSGVQVERPPFSGQSNGPQGSDLCKGCKQGHCSKMGLEF